MSWARRFTYMVCLVLFTSFLVSIVPDALDPTTQTPRKRARDKLWVSSSPYWLDRQACTWLSLCGLHHLRKDPAAHGGSDDDDDDEDDDEWSSPDLRRRSEANQLSWTDGRDDPHSLRVPSHQKRDGESTNEGRVLQEVPDYVMHHAPLVHLYSNEEFWPSDIREHVEHMTVFVDNEPVNMTDYPKWNLNNLHLLNKLEGHIVLRSNDDVETRPPWLHSHANEPTFFPDDPENEFPPRVIGKNRRKLVRPEKSTWYDVDKDHPIHRIADPRHRKRPASGFTRRQKLHPRGHKPDEHGYSSAPAVLVVVDKGSGIVDAFWFFFYSYNLGQTVLGIRFGNHVGDWEHCLVRFQDGIPKGMFFSEHEGGQAYAWDALEKRGERPVIYSAVGSHAMYSLPGQHPYVLPFGLLRDVTDKGPLWDPSLNNYAYHYDYTLENPENDGEQMEKDPVELQISESRAHRGSHRNARYNPYSLAPAASNPDAPISWFHYRGSWGDEVYSLADMRQWRFFGQYHYVTGPDGPKFKSLDRSLVCQNHFSCQIAYELDLSETWY